MLQAEICEVDNGVSSQRKVGHDQKKTEKQCTGKIVQTGLAVVQAQQVKQHKTYLMDNKVILPVQ